MKSGPAINSDLVAAVREVWPDATEREVNVAVERALYLHHSRSLNVEGYDAADTDVCREVAAQDRRDA